jgi:hypothetical protein
MLNKERNIGGSTEREEVTGYRVEPNVGDESQGKTSIPEEGATYAKYGEAGLAARVEYHGRQPGTGTARAQ